MMKEENTKIMQKYLTNITKCCKVYKHYKIINAM